jgi:NADH:ubiquinone oxidoreductase subunit 6 (subunit J)
MTVLASALVKWDAVGKILLAGLVGGVGVVVVFGFLVLGVSRARRERSPGARLLNYTLSGVCGVICVAAVVVGIYAMVNKPSSSSSKPKPKPAALVGPGARRSPA